jgi:hypothetical protein
MGIEGDVGEGGITKGIVNGLCRLRWSCIVDLGGRKVGNGAYVVGGINRSAVLVNEALGKLVVGGCEGEAPRNGRFSVRGERLCLAGVVPQGRGREKVQERVWERGKGRVWVCRRKAGHGGGRK